MEKLAREVDQFFQEHLKQYHALIEVLRLESGFITKMDVQSLWAATSRKKEIAAVMATARQTFLCSLETQGIDHGMESGRFSLSRLLGILPLSRKMKSTLEKQCIAINTAMDELKQVADANQRNIREYLGVIDGVITTVTGAVQPKSYASNGLTGRSQSFYGARIGNPATTSLIRAQV